MGLYGIIWDYMYLSLYTYKKAHYLEFRNSSMSKAVDIFTIKTGI